MSSIVENRNRSAEPTELQILPSLDAEHLEDVLPGETHLWQRLLVSTDDREHSFFVPRETQRLMSALEETDLDASDFFVPVDDPEWWPDYLQNLCAEDGGGPAPSTNNTQPTSPSSARGTSRSLRPGRRHYISRPQARRREVNGSNRVYTSSPITISVEVAATTPEESHKRRIKGRNTRRESQKQRQPKSCVVIPSNLTADQHSLLDTITCPICMDHYDEGADRAPCTLSCGHSFCLSHLSQCHCCPICRKGIPCSTRGYLKKSVALCDASKAITSMLAKMSV